MPAVVISPVSPSVVSRSTYVSFLLSAASSATVTSSILVLLVASDVCRLLDGSSFGVSARLPSAQLSPRVIQTSQGKLRGILITRSSPGRQQQQQLPPVEAYLGLQYASTLGSDLRFMPPTSSMEKWEGIPVALKFRPVCPQPLPDIDQLSRRLPRGRVDHFRRLMPFLERQNEECLYLNIYTPLRESSNTSTSLLPVVVFIHGESYDIGTGNAYDGSMLAAYGMVVVVTINYRLGILGFLSTGDSNAPGNYGLLDQVAALHWIKENIGSFGGNSAEVTLLGHGYGAALVNLLMVSPITKDSALFRRVIMHSGSALSTWSMVDDPLYYTNKLAELVNCSSTTAGSTAIPTHRNAGASGTGTSAGSAATGDNHETAIQQTLTCLKRLPVERLMNAGKVVAPRFLTAFGPTVDGRSVVPHDIRRLTSDLSEETGFGRVDLLQGIVSNEGFVYFNQSDIDEGIGVDRLHRILRTYVRNIFRYQRQYIYDVVLYQYQQDTDRRHQVSAAALAAAGSFSSAINDAFSLRDIIMELLGDAQQGAPAVDLVRRHSEAAMTAALSALTTPSAATHPLPPSRISPSGGASTNSVTSRRKTGSSSATNSSTTPTTTFFPIPVVTSSTYFYVFNHATHFDVYPRWAEGVHADDLAYVFGAPVAISMDSVGQSANEIDPFATIYSAVDRSMSETIMRYWSNFIWSGNPNVQDSAKRLLYSDESRKSLTYWPRYNADTQQYLQLGVESVIRHHYRADKMALWLGLIPRLHRATISADGSDHVDERYHRLDDHFNSALFDDDSDVAQPSDLSSVDDDVTDDRHRDKSLTATKTASAGISRTLIMANGAADQPEVVTSVDAPGFTRKQSRRVSSTPASFGHHSTTTLGMNARQEAAVDRSMITPSSHLQRRMPNDVDNSNDQDISGTSGTVPEHHQTALIATIVTGCAALVLNCAVFIAICMHRSRVSHRTKTQAAVTGNSAISSYRLPPVTCYSESTFNHVDWQAKSRTSVPAATAAFPVNSNAASSTWQRTHHGNYSTSISPRISAAALGVDLVPSSESNVSVDDTDMATGSPAVKFGSIASGGTPVVLSKCSVSIATLPPPPPPRHAASSASGSPISAGNQHQVTDIDHNNVHQINSYNNAQRHSYIITPT